MTPIASLSEKQLQALEALSTYRYLTAQQLVDLNIASSTTNARDQIFSKLETGRQPLAKAHNAGRFIGYGQLPYIHYLTKYGAIALAEYYRVPLEKIIYPKGGVQFQRDIFHRIKVIDYHIKFRQWAKQHGYRITIADMYFDKIGSQRQGGQVSKTKVILSDGSFIEPDAILGIQHQGQDSIYVLEYHRHTDKKRVAQQLSKVRQAIDSDGAINRKYQVNTRPLLLSISAT